MGTKTQGVTHEYIKILEEQAQATRKIYLSNLASNNGTVQAYTSDRLREGATTLVDVVLQTDEFEANCAVLRRLEDKTYEPTVISGTYTITRADKLRLYWASYVLTQLGIKLACSGKIVGSETKNHTVNIEKHTQKILPLVQRLQEWQKALPDETPGIVLNTHCELCQFHALCRQQAEEDDNLSLLYGMTAKMIRQYEKKGIFTVKQLSYLYKPRKRKKRSKKPPITIHKRELQALAIREHKSYLEEVPEVLRQSGEIFLDIEGNPDTQQYYLIGMLACQEGSFDYNAFWADSPNDEEHIWRQFLARMNQFPATTIYHYGSYEARALEKLAKRYETPIDSLLEKLVNVNHFIYGKIYYPVYSNRLKELGRFLGAEWTSPKASGIQTLVWRHYWEKTANTQYKDHLLTYNQEDCQALKLLTDELIKITESADTLSDIELADKRKQPKTDLEKQIHAQLRAILNFSYLQYDKKKIRFRQEENKPTEDEKKEKCKKIRNELDLKLADLNRRVQKTIEVAPRTRCPRCGSSQLRPYDLETHRLILDLKLTRNGLKKTITKFVGKYQSCLKCYVPCAPAFTHNCGQIYGHGVKAWIAYHRVALRLPYESISESFKEQFRETIGHASFPSLIHSFAGFYTETVDGIKQHLLESPFIHADETRINIMGANWYVWVFTDGQYILLKLQETREATIVHELLADYSGVLISDFYPGYDAVDCPQQKCWVHLIGDLNNDLWQAPFDKELETFILHVKELIIPIMECIQKYGLKQRHLRKFEKEVETFYENYLVEKSFKSDLMLKYQKRFLRYRDSLFTFLKHDDILWHNNPAEWAIRPIAKQRAISTAFGSRIAEDYLVLLGIRQTCRSQGKSFFKFLFSGQKNLDLFEALRHKRNEYCDK